MYKMNSAANYEEQTLLLASIVASSNDAILTETSEGIITTWNSGAEIIYGYSSREIIGKARSILIPPEQVEASLAVLQRIKHGERLNPYKAKRVCKDGRQIDVSESLTPLTDPEGHMIGAFTIAREITDDIEAHQQTEARLVAASQYARSLMETSMELLVVLSPEGKVTEANEASTQVTGFSREELIGSDFSIYFTEPERAREGYRQVVASGVVPNYPLTLRHKNGRLIDMLYNARVHQDSQGNVLCVFVSARDVSAQKQASQLKRNQRALINMLDEIATERAKVQQAKALVEAANADLESFAYSVAHDLRAPLRSMDGFSQALQEEHSSQLDEQGQEYLNRIRRASRTMGQLIDDLLGLSRVIRTDIHKERIDLSELAENICLELKKSQPDRPVEFKIAPGLLVSADQRLIKIALENLLGNAWKFTSRLPMATIELGANPINNQWVFFIRDNGAGFNMAYANKLFKPFQRLHSQKEFPGTGIGLATVERIIHRHDGKIWTEGAVGKGATFYFTLGESHSKVIGGLK